MSYVSRITPKRFLGGFHPAYDGKDISATSSAEKVPLLDKYIVPVQQNIGASPKLSINKGDTVKKGQVIAEPGGFVSVPLHSPTSGTVGETMDIPGANGIPVQAVEIISDGKDEWGEPMPPMPNWKDTDREKLKERILAGGVVGMGGAAFPSHVKLSPPPEKQIDTLVVNGAECEPYLTADDALMQERADAIIEGAGIVSKILKISRVLIGIEENKPKAIEAMRKASEKWADAEVVPLRVRYPQGAEKQLIYALTGRKVVSGGLPMDVGCVVHNVATCAAIRDAVVEGRPLIERVVTITGTPVKKPGNYLIRIGTPLRKALEFAQGIKSPTAKLILGGPMMGFAQTSLDVAVSKNTSGILLFSPEEAVQFQGEPCLSCGRCVDRCPMKLLVSTLSKLAERGEFTLAEENHVMDCMECGACAYICPAGRPNVQLFRRAKAEINALRRKK